LNLKYTKTNNDLSNLVDSYLDRNKNKKIFYDKTNQFNIEKVKNIINNITKNLYKLSKKNKTGSFVPVGQKN